MRNEDTLRKLKELRLSGMAEAYEIQCEQPNIANLSFEERFTMLVDSEVSRRRNNKLNRLIKKATFSNPEALIERIEYYPDRHLDQRLIEKLATGSYISNKQNIILMGASGSGKTWIANAFGMAACRQFRTTKYIRLSELLDELKVARYLADNSFRKKIKAYQKFELLIIDEWLLTPISDEDSLLILEVLESRLYKTSTIFCSQFSPEGWHHKIKNDQLADAILDRTVHNSYKILIDGEKSMRERHGIDQQSEF